MITTGDYAEGLLEGGDSNSGGGDDRYKTDNVEPVGCDNQQR